MYSVILDKGAVVRMSDKRVIAPCESEQDPDFLAYIAWVNAGNKPKIYDSDYEGWLPPLEPPVE
jgi:hypothetical protein